MVKFLEVLYVSAILVGLASGITIKPKVNDAICEEDMGICDESCNSKCESSKQGFNVKGSCEIVSSDKVARCKCLYDCGENSNSTAKNKKCNVGIAQCSFACNDVCCDQNCAAKFPDRDGHGYCLSDGTIYVNECVCVFHC